MPERTPRPSSHELPDVDGISDELYRQWQASLGQWWDTVLGSQDVLGATGQHLADTALGVAAYEDRVDQHLARLHLPTRGDLTRLARIATLLEKRLLQTEDIVLKLQDTLAARDQDLARVEREALHARIEVAELRAEIRATTVPPATESAAPVDAKNAPTADVQ